MKKSIIIAISLALIAVVSATSIVVARSAPPSDTPSRLENALNQQLEKAFENGLIGQEVIDNIHDAWSGKSEEEQLQLYNRVCNMIQSKQKQARLKNAFFSTLDKAIELGYIDASRYDSISRLWAQSDSAQKEQLYDRLCNMMEAQGQTRGQ